MVSDLEKYRPITHIPALSKETVEELDIILTNPKRLASGKSLRNKRNRCRPIVKLEENEWIQYTTLEEIYKEKKKTWSPIRLQIRTLLQVLYWNRSQEKGQLNKPTSLMPLFGYNIQYMRSGWNNNDTKSRQNTIWSLIVSTISLLPVINKVFVKILFKGIDPIIKGKDFIPSCRSHNTKLKQVYHINDTTEETPEETKIYSIVPWPGWSIR